MSLEAGSLPDACLPSKHLKQKAINKTNWRFLNPRAGLPIPFLSPQRQEKFHDHRLRYGKR